MDLTSLIGPILNLVGANSERQRRNGDFYVGQSHNASLAALDRTLGAAATLGVTIALYRVIKSSISQNKDGGQHPKDAKAMVTIPVTLLYSFIQVTLNSFLSKRIESSGDGYFNAAYQNKSSNAVNEEDKIPVYHRGSCHCKSIEFMLRAPKRIQARDCEGTIRYPHYLIAAENFHLTQGSEYLSVYYVNLPAKDNTMEVQSAQMYNENPMSNQTVSSDGSKLIMAAHTFCKRCGVHILRAPDSASNHLEVNTNCLVGYEGDNGNTQNNVEVTYYEPKEHGLGRGWAIQKQWNDDIKADDPSLSCLDEEEASSHTDTFQHIYNSPLHSQEHNNSFKAVGWTYSSSFEKSHMKNVTSFLSPIPGTPSTTATTVSDSMLPQESMLPSVSGISTLGGNPSLASSEDSIFRETNNDNSNETGNPTKSDDELWSSFAPSSTQTTPRTKVTSISPSTSFVANQNPPEDTDNFVGDQGTFASREKLKYYMKKHLTPSSKDSSITTVSTTQSKDYDKN